MGVKGDCDEKEERDRKLYVKVGVEKERELKSRNIRCVGEGDETNKPTQEKRSKKIKRDR